MNNFIKTLACVCPAFISFASGAEALPITHTGPIREFWLNPGFYSYHFQKNKGLNNSNFGLGGEYRYSTASSVTLGMFENSDRKKSHYAGWYWQPLELGYARFGAGLGAISGYPKMRNGGWFFAVIPTASIEYESIGANLIFIPGYRDKVYGSISLH